MHKPFTNYLSSNREIIESRIANHRIDSAFLKDEIATYERLQMLAITEQIEEDLLSAAGPDRARLYSYFLRFAALRERTTARTSREHAAEQRRIDRQRRDQERVQRQNEQAELRRRRDQERAERQQQRAQSQAAREARRHAQCSSLRGQAQPAPAQTKTPAVPASTGEPAGVNAAATAAAA